MIDSPILAGPLPEEASTAHQAIVSPPSHPDFNAHAREERIFLVLSMFIGVLSGLLVVCFRMAIEWLTVLLQGSAPAPHQPRLILVPFAAGLVVALLTRFVFPGVRGSGVNQTKAALYIHNGYISLRTMIGKFLLCAVALGSGFSSGPEDPSLQIGAAVASVVSRRIGLSREKLRIFAPVGAAAGLAAAFNGPHLGHPLRHRGGHRPVERRCPGLHCDRRRLCGGGRPLVLGSGTHVPHPRHRTARSA